MDIASYLGLITRGWWVILTALVVSILATAIFSYNQTPIYRAEATFVVSSNPRQVDPPRANVLATYAEVGSSRVIVERARSALKLASDPTADYTIRTVVRPDADIVQLAVEGPDPQITAALANAASRETIAYAQNLYVSYQLSILDPAVPPSEPIRPQHTRDLALGAALGLALGLGLAFAREYTMTPSLRHA